VLKNPKYSEEKNEQKIIDGAIGVETKERKLPEVQDNGTQV